MPNLIDADKFGKALDEKLWSAEMRARNAQGAVEQAEADAHRDALADVLDALCEASDYVRPERDKWGGLIG